MNTSLLNIIAQQLNLSSAALQYQTVGGGCINHTYKLSASGKHYFCKINSASKFPQMLQKEGNALSFLAAQNIIKTPKVLHYAETDKEQILILEWINSAHQSNNFWKTFGRQLAALHLTSNKTFGWYEANYMGSVVQQNQYTEEWNSFFTTQRLMPVARQCQQQSLLTSRHISKLENLCKELYNFFSPEPPALLHGDLWSGNFMCNEKDEPVLIDPAIYFGHRSVDLGMTTLFGGFDKAFYEAYHYHYPLPANYQQQWKICNLYPLFIHLLLFGNSYLSQIEQTLKEFS